jgi:hypothetical protein
VSVPGARCPHCGKPGPYRLTEKSTARDLATHVARDHPDATPNKQEGLARMANVNGAPLTTSDPYIKSTNINQGGATND